MEIPPNSVCDGWLNSWSQGHMLRKTCLNWWLCNMDLSVSDSDYTPWKNIFSAEECLKWGTIPHVRRCPQQKVQLEIKLIKNAGRNLKKCRAMMKKDGCLSEFQGALQSSSCVQQDHAVLQPCSGTELTQLHCLPRNCKKATPERFHLCNSSSRTKHTLGDV